MANDNDMKVYGVQKAEAHPIKVSVVVSLTVILAFIWVFMRPALGEDLAKYFITKVEMKQHTNEVMSRLDIMQHDQRDNKAALNGLRTQANMSSAFQMERGFKDDLNEHDADKPSPTTAKWRADKREIEGKLEVVSQYKVCVLAEKKNCDEIQRQLWQ